MVVRVKEAVCDTTLAPVVASIVRLYWTGRPQPWPSEVAGRPSSATLDGRSLVLVPRCLPQCLDVVGPGSVDSHPLCAARCPAWEGESARHHQSIQGQLREQLLLQEGELHHTHTTHQDLSNQLDLASPW